jgi:CyaY protein
MTDADFETLADAALDAVEAALEASGVEADVDRKGDGVLEVEFDGGAKLIVNRHRPAREIWVAAPSGGFHFRWDGAAWRDSRGGAELFAALSQLASALGGRPVTLRP